MIIQCHGLMMLETTIVDSQEDKYLHVSVINTINDIGRSFYLNKAQLKTLIIELKEKEKEMGE